MCVLVLHVPAIVNLTYEPTYATHFGWGVNLLNVLYFIY